MKILLATRNRDKIREIRAALQDLNFELISAESFKNLPEILEDAPTLEGNAIQKARTLFEITGMPTLADDTGLEVDALQGAPGIYSSRYGGPNATYAENVSKLLKDMRDVPVGKRQARFRTVVAFASRKGIETIEGVCEGEITFEPQGENNFGYDPIFFVPEMGKTLAEMTLDEKNKVSHRGRALGRLKEWLREGQNKKDAL